MFLNPKRIYNVLVISQASFEYVVKSTITDDEQRIIEGFATVQVIDRDSEILDVDSIAKSFEQFMKNPVLLLHHDLTKPVGRVLDYEIRMKNGAKGIWIRAQIAKGTKEADETWSLVKQGIIKAFSIRGRIGTAKTAKQNGKRIRIAEITDLLEVSLVSVPANPEALIEVVLKSLGQLKEENSVDQKEIQKSLVGLKDELKKEFEETIEKRFSVLESKIEEIVKKLDVGKVEEQPSDKERAPEELRKYVTEVVEKAIEENAQLLVLKKALGIVPEQDPQQNSVDAEENDGPIDLQKFAKLVKEGGI